MASVSWALAGALALTLGASSAPAAVIFTGYQTDLDPDQTMLTSFEGGLTLEQLTFAWAGFSLSGDALLSTGSEANMTAAPAESATKRDDSQYLSVRGGQSATLTTPGLSKVSFYVGSLDRWNSFAFTLDDGSTQTMTGAMIAALPGMSANGNQASAATNGRLTFWFDRPIQSVTLFAGANTLEVSDIGMVAAFAAAPEPAAWGMMILGMGGAGALLRSRRTRMTRPQAGSLSTGLSSVSKK